MGSSEKFCLRWNDFEANISGAFRELREDKDFFDVTLACDDDQIQAHKVILSACSPFFRTILKRNRHEHPLLFLKGVRYVDLVSVLNFMYHGEVNVAQEELNSFLAVAEDLKVKGLTQNNSSSGSENRLDNSKKTRDPPERVEALHQPPKRSRPPPPSVPSSISRPAPQQSYQHQDEEIQEVVPVKSEPVSQHSDPPVSSLAHTEQPYTVPRAAPQVPHQIQHEGVVADPNMEYCEDYGDYEGYEEGGMDASYDGTMINSSMGGNDSNKDDTEALVASFLSKTTCYETGKTVWQCNKCEKSSKVKTQMKNHVESIHLSQQLIFSCNFCSHTNHTSAGLKMHIRRNHMISITDS